MVDDGTYRFTVKGDDGLRIFVDGSPLTLTQVGGSAGIVVISGVQKLAADGHATEPW